jgi:hypothetical protein
MASISVKYNLNFEAADGVWRVQAWTSDAVDITEKIFVHQAIPDTPGQALGRTMFTNVAQPSEDAAAAGSSFFRKSSLDLEIKSPELMHSTVKALESDIRGLILAVNEVA